LLPKTLVVDANVFIAATLADSGTRKALLKAIGIQLLTPEFTKIELRKYMGEIATRLKTQKAAVAKKMEDIFEAAKIVEIPKNEYAQYAEEAHKLSPDPNDVPYMALALAKQCPLWSQDKALKRQSKIVVLDTAEIIATLKTAGKVI